MSISCWWKNLVTSSKMENNREKRNLGGKEEESWRCKSGRGGDHAATSLQLYNKSFQPFFFPERTWDYGWPVLWVEQQGAWTWVSLGTLNHLFLSLCFVLSVVAWGEAGTASEKLSLRYIYSLQIKPFAHPSSIWEHHLCAAFPSLLMTLYEYHDFTRINTANPGN